MVALVTGGAGFIGSNLVEELGDVVVLDDFATSNDLSKAFVQDSAVRVLEGSITDEAKLKEALDGVDIVFHQAAVPSVPRSVKDPITSNSVNAGGTLTLLKACVDNGVKNVVYASSSSVYGDTPTLPKVETMQPNSKSPYAVSKFAGEEYMRVFGELYDLKTACLRYFNVFGPRQNPDSEYAAVVPKFVKAALAGEALTIYGDGSQTRDFTFVKDVVEANKKAVGKRGVFNIAGGKQTSINDLASMIIDLTESKSEIKHLDERKGDVKHSLADIAKTKKELGWNPKYSLEQGLKDYIDYYTKLSE
jgi:UDP-glucose 4-epimerase